MLQKVKLGVEFPAGVYDDCRIKISGVGEQTAPDGPRGDVYVFVRIAPDRAVSIGG